MNIQHNNINGSISSVNHQPPASPKIHPNSEGKVTDVKNDGDIKKYEEQQRRKHQLKAQQQAKPFCFSKMLVRCPCLILLFVALFIIFAMSLIIALDVFKFDESGNRTYLVWSADVVKAYDEITLAQGLVRDSIFSGSSVPHSSLYEDWMTFFVYRAKNSENILDSQNLIKIKQFQDALILREDFQKFCQVNHSNPTQDVCDETSFSASLFSNLFNGIDLTDQNAINSRVLSILNSPLEKSLIDKQLSAANLQATFGRSIITFASPLQGFKNIFDNQDAQKEKFIQFNIDIDNQAKKFSTQNFDILFGSRPYLSHQLTVTANNDLFLAVASFLAVYLYVTIHLRSFILASFGMLQTLLAFPVAYFFYRVIFQISFFTTIHNLAIFIILGVAADDLFVFNDAWRQSGKFQITKGDLNKRMALTYKRASKAMFVTSFTTASAFLATGFSDIMPISSFGFFASILIISNYCLVITMFPAFLMFTQKKCGKFLIWQECCCNCRKKSNERPIRQLIRKDQAVKNSNENLEKFNVDNGVGMIKNQSNAAVLQINEKQIMDKIQDIQQIQNEEDENNRPNSLIIQQDKNQEENHDQSSEIQKLGCLQKFFSTKFNSFVRKFSILILIILIIWVAVASYFASQMKPLSQQEQWLPDDNRVNQTYQIIGTEFPLNKNDSLVKVTLFWGVSGVDRSSTSRWDDSNIGQIEWDPQFDISHPDAQQLFLTFCEEIKSFTGQVVNATPNGGGQVLCFMQGFKNWLISNSKSFPVAQNNFYNELQLFTQDNAASLLYRNDGTYGFDQGRVRVVSIDAVTTIEFRQPSSRKDPVIEYWNNVIAGFNERAKSNPNTMGLSLGKVSGGNGFAWTASEKAFVSNAVRGMIISGILAFFVLVFSTCNLIVGTYAIIGIAGVIVSVVSNMVFQGWQFGVSQSLAVVILIGFSVDYVVHLANHYVESLSPKRHQRMRESYGQIGISIIGGAITTFLSGAVLFGTQLLIFFKFATLITLTVVFSLIFSLLGFGSISHLIGPQNMFGSLWSIFCCDKCRQKKKKKHDDVQQQRLQV